MADLLINGLDAKSNYGVRIGDDFLDTLGKTPDCKEHIENDSPLEDGTQTIPSTKLASRTITLTFRVTGATHEQYIINKRAFETVLHAGELTLQVPSDSSDIYHLVFSKCTSYAQNTRRTSCTIAAQFTEPNPANRT